MTHYSHSAQTNPVILATQYLCLPLDPWQKQALDPLARFGVLNCARQTGKTTVTAIRAVHHLLFHPNASVLIVSHTLPQAALVFRKIQQFLTQLGESTQKLPGRPFSLELTSTGAQLTALPCRETSTLGYTATLVLLDEAAQIPDSVYHSITGTLASTWHSASLWILSTPRQSRGFFYDHCTQPEPGWTYLSVTAAECPRISKAYLDRQRQRLGPERFAQDYECQFANAHDAVFRDADLTHALTQNPAPTIGPGTLPLLGRNAPPSFYLGLDLAQLQDHSSLVLIEHRGRLLGQHPETLVQLFQGELHVRWAQRLPLGLGYHDVIRHLRHILGYPELQATKSIELVYDRTGIGTVFHDFLRQAQLGVRLTPVSITGGHDASQSNGTWNVPKHELIHYTQFAFQHKLIRIAPDCPGLADLRHEMASFRRIPTPGGSFTFAGAANQHDDLVMSLAMAVWRAIHQHKGSILGGLHS